MCARGAQSQTRDPGCGERVRESNAVSCVCAIWCAIHDLADARVVSPQVPVGFVVAARPRRVRIGLDDAFFRVKTKI